MNCRSLLLLVAAIPALIGSLLLMSFASVAWGPILQQAVVTIVGLAWLLMPRRRQDRERSLSSAWPMLAMAALLFVPQVFGVAGNPHRWLVLGGARLYLAPVVIPLVLLSWPLAAKGERAAQLACAVALILIGLALLLQPDASQLTAFALAAVALVLRSALARALKLAVAAGLLVLALISWQLPDPLQPVLHVEGVFQLARQISALALMASIVAAALPALVLAWLSFTQLSEGLLAVAVYYATLLALAPLQLTPVPLLGFGAGPVLGYFLAARLASAARTS